MLMRLQFLVGIGADTMMENVPSDGNDILTTIMPSSHWINIGGAAMLAEVHGREHEAAMFRRSAGYTDDGTSSHLMDRMVYTTTTRTIEE